MSKPDLSHIDFNALTKAVQAIYAPENNTTHVLGYDFVCTSHACPEQYDVYYGSYTRGLRVAYVRKRYGHLSARLVKNGHTTDTVIYSEEDTDEWNGVIDNKEQTLRNIAVALNKFIVNRKRH